MIEPTSKDDALAAVRSAEQRLVRVQARADESSGIMGSLRGLLEENHFSARLARAYNLKDDRP